MNNEKKKTGFLFHINCEHRNNPLKFGSLRLIQIGRTFCSPTTAILPHVHLDWFELTIVTGGKGSVAAGNQLIPIKEGDIFLSLPCETHAVYSDEQNPLKYDFFSFFTVDEEKRSRLENLLSPVYTPEKRLFRNEKIEYLVAAAIEEINSGLPDGNAVLTALFEQVLLYLLRDFEGRKISALTHLSDAELLCYKLTHYLDTHVYSLKNLYELSAVTNYNYSYLSAVFHKTTGATIAEYFHGKKLEAAKELLKEGKLKTSEIAELLNYSSIYAFSKAFKRCYGVPPSQASTLA